MREEPGSTRSFLLDDSEALVERHWAIEVVAGPDLGKRLERAGGTLVVGTHPEADLVLTDPSVSRRHAELVLTPDGVLIVDLGSRNKTRVGRQEVDRAFVAPGATVRLGHTELLFQPIDPRAAEEPTERFGEFVTRSPKLQRMLGKLSRVARSDATVLIEGETGTGKELLAQAIHDRSPRAERPLVVVDCSSMVESLLEAQLFGHAKGAFTGATDDRAGAFEAAEGGSIFLDELGELPIALQPKLLRVLESRKVRPLGTVEDRPIDVRLLAATNRDLEAMVREGRFRSDLYFRLAVVRARVPPLRERREDIALLAEHYLRALGRGAVRLLPETIAALHALDWPGNGRELRNVIERALATTEADVILPSDVLDRGDSDEEAPQTFREVKERVVHEFEAAYVVRLLDRHGGNVASAAREAGLSRNALYALMRRAGLAVAE